jgi:hypothetical protein
VLSSSNRPLTLKKQANWGNWEKLHGKDIDKNTIVWYNCIKSNEGKAEMIAYYKPTAKDSARARKLLKEAGIKISIRKALRTVHVGRQCERVDKSTATRIISILEDNGFILQQRDIIFSLIDKGLADTFCFFVAA